MALHRHILHFLQRFLGRRASRPEDIPRALDAETLALVMKEAETLQKHFKVDVRPVGKGELPIPRRADKDAD